MSSEAQIGVSSAHENFNTLSFATRSRNLLGEHNGSQPIAFSQPQGVAWEFGAVDASSYPSRPECRRSKSLRNLANLLDNQHLIGSPPPSPQDRPAPAQTWPRTSAMKVCSIQRYPVIDGADFITVAGANDGRGPVVDPYFFEIQCGNPSGALTPTTELEDVTMCGCILLWRIRQMFMILAVLYEQEVPLNTPDEEPDWNAPDLHQAETQSEAQDRGEHKDQRAVAGQPSNTSPVQISGDDRVGEDEYNAVKSKEYRGECPCCGTTLGSADLS